MEYSYEKINGLSQYEDCDFTKNNTVQARYIPAKVPMDKGNPYIEALPYPRQNTDVHEAYTRDYLSYRPDKVKQLPKLDRMLQAGMLRHVRFPLPFHEELEFQFYQSILCSYRERASLKLKPYQATYVAENKEQETSEILRGDSANATNAGFSLIGYSGCGKSSSISILLEHYPQVILHPDKNDRTHVQILYLVVNCVANSNFVALYKGIGEAIDKALGNTSPVYESQIERTRGLGNKADMVKKFIDLFAIGIIIFDEIQLIDFKHTKENSFDSLLTLANRTKVAMAVVGTEDAKDLMFNELRTARRIGQVINGNLYCHDTDYFHFLIHMLLRYQWFDQQITLNEDLFHALYDVTKGIVEQLISIYICMTYEYLSKKKRPCVDGKFVKYVAKKYFPGIQEVLANLETPDNFNKLDSIRRNAEEQMNLLLGQTRQENASKAIMSNAQLTDSSELFTIATNIKSISDFSDKIIQSAYNKVKNDSSSHGKSTKELTQLVLEAITAIQKTHSTGSSKTVPQISTKMMQDFITQD